jgi:hypothetical protein
VKVEHACQKAAKMTKLPFIVNALSRTGKGNNKTTPAKGVVRVCPSRHASACTLNISFFRMGKGKTHFSPDRFRLLSN